MEHNELKPCPFCGYEEILLFYFDPYDGYQGDLGMWNTKCALCGARIGRRDKAEAIKDWNRRTGNGKGND